MRPSWRPLPAGWQVRFLVTAIFALACCRAFAGGVQTLDPVDVTDAADNLVGTADTSTEGTITQEQIRDRPLLRTGELLEQVPGLIISQHSGEGKANQYYLRGVNLDHGTDFATTVDDMPVNMVTHAHGQGYSDLNFVIPEMLSDVQYRKGPYYADEGDFSAVGAAHLNYATMLAVPIAQVTIGNNNYERAFVGGSVNLLKGTLLLGGEFVHDDGPWVNPDNFRKFNGMVRYTHSLGAGTTLTVDALGYHGDWTATNQSADRAIGEGLISRYGTLDSSDRGSTYRYSLSAKVQHVGASSVGILSAYVIDYGLDLFNDFTYFLDNPLHGDQFHQKDRRFITGGKASQTWFGKLLGGAMDNTIGLQVRNDNIGTLGLYHSDAAADFATNLQEHVAETSVSPYVQNRIQWTPWLRTVTGVRLDYFHVNVLANIAQNTGKVDAVMVNPKESIIFGPWAKTELFLSGGSGFHSNDARAATEHVDEYGNLQTIVPLLERAIGAEVGARTAIIPHLQTELTAWYLHLASEQIFAGDDGTTEPSLPSHRYGVELANYYTPVSWLVVDADVAWSHAQFVGDDAGQYIAGSPSWVISAGATLVNYKGFFATVRMHYFGPRPQIDNAAVVSNSSTIINARVGYQIDWKPLKGWRASVDFFNIVGNKTTDIDYYYTSRLPGEPAAGVNDIHTHPADPLQVRATIRAGVLSMRISILSALLFTLAWASGCNARSVARPSGTGDGGVILTFEPGASPVAQPSGTTQELNDVAFADYPDGGGLFVAVGSTGTILSSPDGAVWTAQSSNVVGNLYDVTWTNNQFVASGEDGVLFGTPDGTSWTVPQGISDLGLGFPLNAATYANGRYLAVGNNQVVTSTDGNTWSALPTKTSGITSDTVDLFDVTYGNGVFVTVGTYNESTPTQEIAYDGLIATSADGSSWNIEQPYQSNYLSGLTFGGGQFVTVGRGGLLLTSADGANWTSHSVPGLDANKTPYLINVLSANGQYVAVGNYVGVNPSTGFILTSPNGVDWVTQETGANVYGVAFGQGLFVAIGGQ